MPEALDQHVIAVARVVDVAAQERAVFGDAAQEHDYRIAFTTKFGTSVLMDPEATARDVAAFLEADRG